MELDTDLFLTLTSGLVQVLLVVMGIYVSLKPPKESRHLVWIGMFVIIGLAGVAVTVIQQYKNSQEQIKNENAQKSLKDQLTTIQEEQKQTRNSVNNLQGLLPKKKPPSPQPEISLSLVYPEHPAIIVSNKSKAIATKIAASIIVYDLDSGYENSHEAHNVQIPNPNYEWMMPGDSSLPLNLFETPGLFSDIKFGHRIVGSMAVNCLNCSRGNTYVVYIELGKGGWVSRIDKETDGKYFLPTSLKSEKGKPSIKKVMEQFVDDLFDIAKPESRIPIKDK